MEFVSERNAAAALALGARREVLLAFHWLEVPSTLNTTFLSTNLIENVLRNWREATCGPVEASPTGRSLVGRAIASTRGLQASEGRLLQCRGLDRKRPLPGFFRLEDG